MVSQLWLRFPKALFAIGPCLEHDIVAEPGIVSGTFE